MSLLNTATTLSLGLSGVGIGTTAANAPLHLYAASSGLGNGMLSIFSSSALSNTANSYDILQRWSENTVNVNYVDLMWIRGTTGSDWQTTSQRFQAKTDLTWQGFIEFNGPNNNYGVTIGSGGSGSNPTSVPGVMYVKTGGNVGIGTSNPGQTLDVYGTIARNSLKLPRVDYATFTTAATVSVPILFNDTQYNMVEIRIRYFPTAQTSMTFSATSTAPANMTIYESQYSYIQYGQTSFTYSSANGVASMPFATNVETLGIDNNALIRITRATGTGAAGNRNHYTIDNVYCWFGVGTTRATSMGHFDAPTVGGPAIASFNITCATGQFSGSYSTTHYN
jgi:hypothetical protein